VDWLMFVSTHVAHIYALIFPFQLSSFHIVIASSSRWIFNMIPLVSLIDFWLFNRQIPNSCCKLVYV
jgi:hypothetical protein